MTRLFQLKYFVVKYNEYKYEGRTGKSYMKDDSTVLSMLARSFLKKRVLYTLSYKKK